MTSALVEEARHSVHFGAEKIPFRLSFRIRQKLAINVHPDRQVSVVAPSGSAVDVILARVQRRAGWIAKQRAHFNQFHPLPPGRRFVSGETHLFLGRQYRLKVLLGATEKVRLVGRFLRVSVRDPKDVGRIERLVERWYRDRAEDLFPRRLRAILDGTSSLMALTPRLVIRTMTKRWGSCTRAKNILLNIDLIKTPLYCIEYVIAHELAHLRVHRHGPEFERALARIMPDWRRRKERLGRFVI